MLKDFLSQPSAVPLKKITFLCNFLQFFKHTPKCAARHASTNCSTRMFRLFIMSDLTYSHWGGMFLLPTGTHLHDCISQCRRPLCKHSLLWKPENFQYTFDLPDTVVWHTAHLFRAEFSFCKTVFSLFPPMRSHKNWNHILPAHVRVN